MQKDMIDSRYFRSAINRACRSLKQVFVFSFAALFVTAQSIFPAYAGSSSCSGTGTLTQSVSAGDASSSSSTTITTDIDLEVGDAVSFSYTVVAGTGSFQITVTASPGSADNGMLVATGSSGGVSFTPTVAGTFTIEYFVSGIGPFTVDFSASCSGSTTPPPASSPADQKSDTTDANDQALDTGRLGTSPDELPGANPDPQNKELLDELFAELFEVYDEIFEVYEEIRIAEQTTPVSEQTTPVSEEELSGSRIGYLGQAFVQLFVPIDVFHVEDEHETEVSNYLYTLNEEKLALEKRIRELGGDPNAPDIDDFTPDNLDDLGDSEALLFFPSAPQNSALNNISAYNAITASASGIQTRFSNQTELGRVWVRSKITYLDGTVGRTGYAGNVQLGFVKALMPGLDVGGFVSGFAGRVTSSTLNSDTTTQGIGAGAYLKYELSDELEAGVSIFYERSNNSITIGPDSGAYARDLLQLSASLSGNYQVGVINIAPRAALNWTYSDRKAYTDSASVIVPASITPQLTATTGVAISRTIFFTEGGLHSITPNVGTNLNYNINNPDVLNLGGGNTIVESTFDAEIFAGAQFKFLNGTTTDIDFGIQGLGGSTQSYSANLGINVPIR